MTNHPGIRTALIAVAGTLALTATACGANSTTATGGQPASSSSPSASGAAGAGEGDTGAVDTGSGGGATTKASPTPKTTTSTPKASSSAAAGPTIAYFKLVGNASCDESGPAFSAPGTVTLTWKVTGATKVALSIDDPGFFAAHGTGTWESNLPATTDEETIPFACKAGNGVSTTHKFTIDTMDGGAHKSMTISATATSHQ